ncbi:MAG TPA: HIT family protein [Candidatus Paceibacterota bacterium]|nr:HIT family protein [Candidatus Paceibacterota bacterium]
MNDCPFCRILESKKERVIEEGKLVFVIFSNPRLMKGHLLVIPKRHVEKPSCLNAQERKELFDTLLSYQDKILSQFSSGCDIRQNCRPFQKQSDLKVNHVHFHLQPRELFDELYEKVQKFETNIFHKVDKIENNVSKIFSNT